MPKGQRPTTLEQRFWMKVNKTASCWLWTAGTSAGRYGNFTTPEHQKGMKAHRFSWALHYGPIPDGLLVLHKCDVGLCIRPDHLFLGTQADNVKDCEAKGRGFHKRGSENGRALLSEEQVREIKVQFTGKRGECIKIANKYGVAVSVIRDIRSGKNWGWLT